MQFMILRHSQNSHQPICFTGLQGGMPKIECGKNHTVMFRVAGVECARSACVKVVEHDSGKPDVHLPFDTIPFYTRI